MIHRWILIITAALFFISLSTSLAMAEEPCWGMRGKAADPAQNAKLEELMERVLLVEINMELGLDERKAAVVLPAVKDYIEVQRKFRMTRHRNLRQLRRLMSLDDPDIGKLDQLLDQLFDPSSNLCLKQHEAYLRLKSVTTPQQRAVIFKCLFRFQKKLMRLMHGIRRPRQDGKPPSPGDCLMDEIE